MSGFSIRTMFFATLGVALLCSLCVYGASSVNMFHMILVLSFAIPSGSLGYDRTRTSRGAAMGTCLGATIGTLMVSAMVLATDYWWIYIARN